MLEELLSKINQHVEKRNEGVKKRYISSEAAPAYMCGVREYLI
jgi:hypothetical protein